MRPSGRPDRGRSSHALSTSLLGILLLLFTGCATVKPWERETQAIRQMEVDDLACHRFERNIEVYREGAVGANGGKSGGGCGCS